MPTTNDPWAWLEESTIRRPDQMLDALLDLTLDDDTLVIDLDAWKRITSRLPLGRNEEPWWCGEVFDSLPVTWEVVAMGLGDAWSAAEWPEQCQPTEWWVQWWQQCGYAVDGVLTERPSEPLTLWRGAVADRMRGMAWTADRKIAEWFARRFDGALEDTGRLYTATVEPSRLLARLHEAHRSEDEYVIDTEGLTITEVKA